MYVTYGDDYEYRTRFRAKFMRDRSKTGAVSTQGYN